MKELLKKLNQYIDKLGDSGASGTHLFKTPQWRPST